MAIKLIANYSKKLGLPEHSSHQFAVTVETEIMTTDDVPGECQRLCALLQANIDGQIVNPGLVPSSTYVSRSLARHSLGICVPPSKDLAGRNIRRLSDETCRKPNLE